MSSNPNPSCDEDDDDEVRLIKLLRSILSEIEDKPSRRRINELRDVLESAALWSEIDQFYSGNNNPQNIETVEILLSEIVHTSESECEDRKFVKDVLARGGVGGGAGIVGGSLIAVSGVLVIVAVAGGAMIMAGSAVGGRKLNREAVAFSQLHNAAKEIRARVRKKSNE